MKNFHKKITESTFWLFLFQIVDNFLGFARLLILARLLSPNDFGLVAIAWLTLQTISTFTQTGIYQTLIHKRNITNYLNTAWTYLFFRGIFLYLILYFITPYLGVFFHSYDSISVIRVIGLSLLLEGLTNIGTVYFQKNLLFHKQFILQIIGNICDFIVAVSLAYILQNVWAIVYGSLANNIIRLLLSYILSSYRPKFEFNLKQFKELNNYGKWIFGSSIMGFIYSQGDDILVGRLLHSTALGYYQLAYKISNLPTTQITNLISTVMFPAYSQIQDDISRISKIYTQILQLVTFLSIFVGTIIILFSGEFIRLFLGSKWLPMVASMQILTIWGVIRSIGATIGPVWQAIGEPKTVTKIQLLQALILVLIIYPFTIYGNIVGTSIAVVIAALIPNIIALYKISLTINLPLETILKEIIIPLVGSIIVVGVYYSMTFIYRDENIFQFILLNIMLFFTYLFYAFVLHKMGKYSLFTNLLHLTKKSFNNKYIKMIEKYL
ncbi:MAG TPA: lipopolysaccharide biosynthesis protein [Candidatus Woesebacteria bacterium]|nr:lipopolysaccharide biosynthesis protein [Candidatus Woesebacteria bacterium]